MKCNWIDHDRYHCMEGKSNRKRQIRIQVVCSTKGLTRPASWSKLSPFSECQGFSNLSSWFSEYQTLAGTKSCFRETGNNSDKESLLIRATDPSNDNQSYMSCCWYSNIMETTILLLWRLWYILHLRLFYLYLEFLTVPEEQAVRMSNTLLSPSLMLPGQSRIYIDVLKTILSAVSLCLVTVYYILLHNK